MIALQMRAVLNARFMGCTSGLRRRAATVRSIFGQFLRLPIPVLHHAAWLARRWEDPAFPIAFPWFDSPRYWEDLVLGLREQLSAMQEPAINLPY